MRDECERWEGGRLGTRLRENVHNFSVAMTMATE